MVLLWFLINFAPPDAYHIYIYRERDIDIIIVNFQYSCVFCLCVFVCVGFFLQIENYSVSYLLPPYCCWAGCLPSSINAHSKPWVILMCI